jgi:NAD(P)-dependent dehydrogenase (short-subunit alcohol dehydrogenase family)
MADPDHAALDLAVQELSREQGHVVGVPTDVEVEDLPARTHETFGDTHLICNIAGVNAYGYDTWEVPDSVWSWVLEVNLHGVINVLRAFVPDLVRRGEGHVVNMSSMSALRGRPQMAPYVASKHAIIGLSEVLQYELQALSPRLGVTVVCPAAVDTNFRTSADRNWPERLGPSAAFGLAGSSIAAMSEPNQLPARDVAEGTLAAVRDGCFMFSPDPAIAAAAVDAYAQIARGQANPQFPPPGEDRTQC